MRRVGDIIKICNDARKALGRYDLDRKEVFLDKLLERGTALDLAVVALENVTKI